MFNQDNTISEIQHQDYSELQSEDDLMFSVHVENKAEFDDAQSEQHKKSIKKKAQVIGGVNN